MWSEAIDKSPHRDIQVRRMKTTQATIQQLIDQLDTAILTSLDIVKSKDLRRRAET